MKKLMILGLLLASTYASAVDHQQTYQTYVDTQGNISLPSDYLMQDFIHVGSNTVADPQTQTLLNINATYVQKSALQEYRQTGQWPDGTMIVKSIKFVSDKKSLLSGDVQHQTDRDIEFVMIKDRVGRFQNTANKAVWGEGWGWAQFTDPKDLSRNTNDDRNYCQGCHMPRKNTDWLYTDIYPLMQR
ncbi:cytochrome P460 family protein [Shewanella waksmanii]|uniref:cytochrome P460 family protein n=1 Tax=Shewanella waksmanii TaxID=213783 RepID=UPI0004B75F49|nr:cytochrome P460 family protein [Shewanella waksmanii]